MTSGTPFGGYRPRFLRVQHRSRALRRTHSRLIATTIAIPGCRPEEERMKLVNWRRLKLQPHGFFVGQAIQHLRTAISCIVTFAMAYTQSDLKAAPTRLTLQ